MTDSAYASIFPDNSSNQHMDTTILVVDDEPNNLNIISHYLEDNNHRIITAQNGQEAWDVLKASNTEVSLILLDRMMPEMDGMKLLEKMKSDEVLQHIPVIMQTAAAEKSQVLEGIEAGVYYYLTKPYEQDMLVALVNAALNDHRQRMLIMEQVDYLHTIPELMQSGQFRIQTMEQATILAAFLSWVYPDPKKVMIGLCELIINGIEHGNLGISYEEKKELIIENKWKEEINKRLQDDEYKDRWATVECHKDDSAIKVTIEDCGEGFNWENYMQIDPARATDPHGRGIALANMISFDDITYIGQGNKVTCCCYL